MNWTKASAIAEILSSVAILVTLVYLVVEIGQNTQALQATARQAALEGDLEYLYRGVDAPELWINQVRADLNLEEKIQLFAYLSSFMRMRERDWLQYQAGALDERTWITYQTGMLTVLSGQQSRKWWEFAKPIFDMEFADYVDGVVQNVPIETEAIVWE